MRPYKQAFSGILLFLIGFLLACGSSSQVENETIASEWKSSEDAAVGFRAAQGWINDWTDLLSEAEEDTLRALVYDHREKTSNQIVYIITDDINGYEDFSQWVLDIGNEWGVGEKEKDNGLIIGLNSKLGKVRINTGLGIEKILPDSVVQRVIDQDMLPFFSEGQFYSGLRNGGLVLMDHLEKHGPK